MQRRPELDAARGVMLVWMTLTHLPTLVSTVANQPFGFFSAAEGFIFLSALFTGRIYWRLANRVSAEAMRRRLWMRTFRLYLYHLSLLSLAFLVATRVAVHGSRPGLHNLLDFYFTAGPARASIDAALLIYRPPLLDILPMYIIFLTLTPLILTVILRVGWKHILSLSFALWFLAQFGLRQAAYDFGVRHFGTKLTINQMGYFDLWAWQFLWMLGLWCGVRWARKDLPIEAWAKRITIPAIVIAPLLLGLRYAVGRGIELGSLEVCFDKWHFGVVRLIDFACLSALLIRSQSVLRSVAFRPLVMLGQASLQVFCAHLFFCFAGLAIMGEAPHVAGWGQLILLVITFAGLLLTAKVFSKSETKIENKNGEKPVVGPLLAPDPAPEPKPLAGAAD
jgi:hypothetical protein